ncbi:hypothetical protein SO802_019864 [Lithocarpus litseifolius]|uniref:Ribonuclease H1 N-terminal domain-containing protein n=1 Tax=Lithocarpus litseifolius TaxID=425828 RepID=A0AAW2CPU5_9ROSI
MNRIGVESSNGEAMGMDFVQWVEEFADGSSLHGGRYYIVFIGRAPGIYDNWAEASRQVHKFANAKHRSYKDRREAESTYMEFLQRNGRNVQYGASPSWASPNMSTSSPGGTSQSEGTSYCDGDVRNRLLRYQLDIAIEECDHARRIATLRDDEVHDST